MAALSLIAAAACTKNEFDSQNVQNNEGRTVLTVELPGETKTILGDAQGDVRPVLWSKGDQISVNGVASQALDIESNAVSADFTLNAELTAPYSIIYPATMVKDGSSVITLRQVLQRVPHVDVNELGNRIIFLRNFSLPLEKRTALCV